RAQMISFKAIRDDGTVEKKPAFEYDGVDAFKAAVEHTAEQLVLPRQAGQSYFIELWCEAAGMAPQLARVAHEYGIPVYSTGGFSSVTVTHEIASRAADRNCDTLFLHVGDYDPSGESIFEAMSEDAR